MKNLSIFILLLILHLVTNGQKKTWLKYNDSTIKETTDFYSSYCTSLNSNKVTSMERIKLDKGLIDLANNLYNSTSTIEELEKVTKGFKKLSASSKDTTASINFRFISNGNLRLTFQAAIGNDSLVRKRISIGTNTKTGCKEKHECCLSYFDFMYIKNYFMGQINFPMRVKPYITDLVIETGSW